MHNDEALITADEISRLDRHRVLRAATVYLAERPITVTAYGSPRSAGGTHDYFSEADYFWPDPSNPGGPYVNRDGYSNPDNFNDHRLALIRLSLHVPALTAAYLLTKDLTFARHAAAHLRAWFIDADTRMNPSLTYAQAVYGVTTGRSWGIIDTLHLVEVARAVRFLEASNALTATEWDGVKEWFAEYLRWINMSENGVKEKHAPNNHGTCWVVQAAAFADLIGDEAMLAECRTLYRTESLAHLAADGSQPLELARSKPYSYAIFNMDILATVCQLLSTTNDSLWRAVSPTGSCCRDVVEFMYSYLSDKNSWPYPQDVEYFDDLPNRQPSLLFAGLAYSEPKYIELWRRLRPDPSTAEIIRNFPIRQPLLWLLDPQPWRDPQTILTSARSPRTSTRPRDPSSGSP